MTRAILEQCHTERDTRRVLRKGLETNALSWVEIPWNYKYDMKFCRTVVAFAKDRFGLPLALRVLEDCPSLRSSLQVWEEIISSEHVRRFGGLFGSIFEEQRDCGGAPPYVLQDRQFMLETS